MKVNLKLLIFGTTFIGGIIAFNWWFAGLAFDTSPVAYSGRNVEPENAVTDTDQTFRPGDAEVVSILSRPLFSPDRKPFVKKKPKPRPLLVTKPTVKPVTPALVAKAVKPEQRKPVPKSRPLLTLHGIMYEDGKGSALISSNIDPDAKWFYDHDEIEGWEISVIDQNLVKVTHDQQSFNLQLYVESGEKK